MGSGSCSNQIQFLDCSARKTKKEHKNFSAPLEFKISLFSGSVNTTRTVKICAVWSSIVKFGAVWYSRVKIVAVLYSIVTFGSVW